MLLHVTVKPNQRFDRLWRHGNGLLAHLRTQPEPEQLNRELIRYLAERLNVAKSLVEITSGIGSLQKTIWIKIPYADLISRIKKLDDLPQASLFEE